MNDPIDAYLDELVSRLSTRRPRELRSMLAEVEAHLRDRADAGVAEGLSPADAEADAVARFGPVEAIAAAERKTWRTPAGVLARQFLNSALLLGAIAAVAVGLSGLLALAVRAVSSAHFLVNSPTPSDLTPGNCARWLGTTAANPVGPGCQRAAVRDWVAEVIGYRIAVGVLGLTLLGVVLLLRRRRGDLALLPAQVRDTIAAGAFAVAGVWLLATGIDALVVSHANGAGQWLSAAPVALGAAAVFSTRLLRHLRDPDSVVA